MRPLTPIVALLLAPVAGAQLLSAEDTSRVLKAVSEVEEIAARNPDLWPGMDLSAIPLAIYQPGGSTLLVGHARPPVGRTYRTRPRVAFWVPAPDACWGAPFADLWGQRTACVEIGELLASEHPAALLVGRAFRAFAGDRLPEPSLGDLAAYPEEDATHEAALELEQRLLDEAVAGDPAAAPARAREWLGVRRDRRARLSERARAFEQHREPASLSAYVTGRAALATGPDRFDRTATGVGRMLDRLAPRWRETFLAASSSFEDRVAAAVKGDARRAAAAARRRHGWNLLLAEAERRARERARDNAVLWGQVEAAGGIGVVAVELPGPFAVRADVRRVRRIDADRLVHQAPLRVDLGDHGLLRFGRPVAQTLSTHRLAARMPAGTRVTADGRPVALDVPRSRRFARLEVVAEGLRLSVEGGVLEVRNRGVVIRPGETISPAGAAP